jgi:hypothetical protein
MGWHEPSLPGGNQGLEVLGEATGTVRPSKGPLDDLALGWHDKPFDLPVGALDDAEPDPDCLIGGPLGFVAGIRHRSPFQVTNGDSRGDIRNLRRPQRR